MTRFVPLFPKDLEAKNWVGGKPQDFKGKIETREIFSPYTGQRIGLMDLFPLAELDSALEVAVKAQRSWGAASMKDRAQVLFRFRELIDARKLQISEVIAAESGKTPAEGLAGLMKGLEVTEFALSLQNMPGTENMRVSSGVWCSTRREPMGVVASITPFNFPAMVPLWTIPIALAMGNAMVWKPSEKTPLTASLIAECFRDAGLPGGVLTILCGGAEVAQALCDHPVISAVTFVGSTPVARSVYERATRAGKRAICLGGAKNHSILSPKADPGIALDSIVQSFTGCAGQRCMASSVLLALPGTESWIQDINDRAARLELGRDMGALIDQNAKERIYSTIKKLPNSSEFMKKFEPSGLPREYMQGTWMQPLILSHIEPGSDCHRQELFGPVLSVVHARNLEHALQLANSSMFGNACSIYTQDGSDAEFVAEHSNAGMIGINIGVPVPREPFSFGGTRDSAFGSGDITGRSGVEFFSKVKKVTTKWAPSQGISAANWMS